MDGAHFRSRSRIQAPSGRIDWSQRAGTRARGDERLSAKQKIEPERVGAERSENKKNPAEKKHRTQRASDIGRALRTVYDDTVREDVPDDFLDLLGKLS